MPSAATSDLPRTVWFLDSRITFEATAEDSESGVVVMLAEARRGSAPPFHVHHTEDEIFRILDGEVRFQVGDAVRTARPGETLVARRGIPHGYRVVSNEARMLVITRGPFAAMVRQLSRPPEGPELPPLLTPTPDEQAALAAACEAHEITLTGPPID